MSISRYLYLLEQINEVFINDAPQETYRALSEILKSEFKADSCSIAWIEGWNSLRRVGTSLGDTRPFPRNTWLPQWLLMLDDSSGGIRQGTHEPGPFGEGAFDWNLSISLSFRSEKIGFIHVGKNHGTFDFESGELCSLLQYYLTPVMYERMQKHRSEQLHRITERAYHESEERFEGIIEESKDMVLSTSLDGRIVYINQAGADLLGYPDPRHLTGRLVMEFWYNQDELDFFNQKIMDQRSVKDFEIILCKSDGSKIFGLASATGFFHPNGTLREITGIVKDISGMVHQQRSLTQANIKLEEAYKKLKETQTMLVQQEKLASIGQLAAGVAHEINNPLSFVHSNFRTLCTYMDRLPKDSSEYTNALEIAAESEEGFTRIKEIIRNLLGFARGDQQEGMVLFDLNDRITESLNVAMTMIQNKASVKVDLTPLSLVKGHPGQINQVILNLLVNAAQALEEFAKSPGLQERQLEISISSGVRGDFVWCSIADNGPGIPESHRQKIFDPFFTTKPTGKGTGLGLSISQEIIARHGGTLVLEPSPQGARFTLNLPVDA